MQKIKKEDQISTFLSWMYTYKLLYTTLILKMKNKVLEKKKTYRLNFNKSFWLHYRLKFKITRLRNPNYGVYVKKKEKKIMH